MISTDAGSIMIDGLAGCTGCSSSAWTVTCSRARGRSRRRVAQLRGAWG